MRRLIILAAAAAVSLSACAGRPRLWEKEGATPQMAGLDLVECRRAARQEAFYETSYIGFGGFSRYGPFPYYGYRRWPFFRPGPYFWGAPDIEFDRTVRLTAFCMHNKGYELTRVPRAPSQIPTVAPGIVPPSAPDGPPPAPTHD